MISVLFLLVASASLSSQRIGTFFTFPEWMPNEVSSDLTPGSPGATNMTQRITSDTLAAVNACFEAFCERSYYFSEGDIDSWSDKVYGPFDRANFWFRPGPAFDYGTNRVVNTARFVETDNLIGLASSISRSQTLESKTIVRRPSWNDGSSPETRRYWSGTAIGDFLSAQNITYDLPDYTSWTEDDPLYGKTAENFKGIAASWGAFKGDEKILAWESRGAESGPEKPFMRTVFDRIHFGQPPFNSNVYDVKVPSTWTSTNSVMDVASSVWGEPNGSVYEWVQTNVTFTFGSVEEIEAAVRSMYNRSGWHLSNESTTVRFEPQYNWFISPGIGTLLNESDLNREFGNELDIRARFRLYAFGFYSEFSESQYVEVKPDVRNYRNAKRNFPMSTPEMTISVRFDGSGSISSFDYSHHLMSQWTNQLSRITFECDARVKTGEVTDSNNQIPALTNMTRRLFSERVAAIGQTLSLIDCSYSHVNPSYDKTGTNLEFQATSKFEKRGIQVELSWPSYPDPLPLTAEIVEDVEIGNLKETGTRTYTNTVARPWSPNLPLEAHFYTGKTKQVPSAVVDPNSGRFTSSIPEGIFDYYAGYFAAGKKGEIHFKYVTSSYLGNGHVDVSCYGDIVIYGVEILEDQFLFGASFDLPDKIEVDAILIPSLSYGFAEGFHGQPLIDTQNGGIHPARRGLALIPNGATLWTIGDFFIAEGTANERIEGIWSIGYEKDSDRRQTWGFHTFDGTFSSTVAGQRLVRSHFNSFLTEFSARRSGAFGWNLYDPKRIFDPILDSYGVANFKLLKSDITVSCGIGLGGITTNEDSPREIDAFIVEGNQGGGVDVKQVIVVGPDGISFESPAFPYSGPSLNVTISAHATSDDQVEMPPYGYHIGAKLEHWTKAEWNWNALRHERNNQ